MSGLITSIDNKVRKDRGANRKIDERVDRFALYTIPLGILLTGSALWYQSQSAGTLLLSVSLGLVGLAAIVVMAYLALRFDAIYPRAAKRWRRQFLLSDLIASLMCSLALAVAYATLPEPSPLQLLIWAMALLYSLLALDSYAPFDRFIQFKYVAIWAPLILVSFGSGSWYGAISAVMAVTVLGSLLVVAERLAVTFWGREESQYLLRQKINLQNEAQPANDHDPVYSSELLTNLGMELRTFLTETLDSLRLLRDTDLAASQKELVAIAEKSGEKQFHYVASLLDYARLTEGRLLIEKTNCQFRRELEALLIQFAHEADSRKIELNYQFVSGFPDRLKLDLLRAKQIITCVVDSVIRHSKSNEVLATIAYQPGSDANGSLSIDLMEVGTPVGRHSDSIELRSLFDFANKSPHSQSGAGLGIALCKGLVTALQGSLTFKQQANGNVGFTLTLPAELKVAQATHFMPNTKLMGMRLLLANAPPSIAEQLVSDLSTWGLTIELFYDNQSLWERLQSSNDTTEPADCLLLFSGKDEAETRGFCTMLAENAALKSMPMFIAASPRQIKAIMTREFMVDNLNITILHKPLELEQFHQLLVTQLLDIHVTPHRINFRFTGKTTEKESRGKILLVEDQRVNQMVAEGMLAKLGYTAKSVSNGVEALRMLDAEDFDLILMDCQMAEMDGYAATEAIRSRENLTPTDKHIPIIALTGNVAEHDQSRCLAVGMDDYLAKPVRFGELESSLKRWLGDSSASQHH